MGRLWLAFRIFFDVLFHADRAEQIRRIEEHSPGTGTAASPEHQTAPAEIAPASSPSRKQLPLRSDALTLLEVLQREARLIDFLQEDITSYSDQQIGSAVREVHRSSRVVLERIFSIVPVLATPEGNPVTIQGNEGAARIRLIGNVVETRPVTGTLVHAGWQAERCDLPQWTGTPEARQILAPAEVELAGK